MTHRHWYKIYIYNNRFKHLNGFANRLMIVFSWNFTYKIRERWLRRAMNSRIRCISRYSSEWFRQLIINIAWKRLGSSNNSNEADAEDTRLETEGKGNGGNSALFNMKDTSIFYTSFIITKLIMVAAGNVMGNFYWMKYWLSQFQIFFFH